MNSKMGKADKKTCNILILKDYLEWIILALT
jgi:hypothetical protein